MLDAQEIEMSETVQVYEFKVQVYEFKTSQGNISRTPPPKKKEQGRQKSWDSYQTTKLSFRSLWIRSRGCSHPGFSSSLPQSSYGSRDDHVMLLTFFFQAPHKKVRRMVCKQVLGGGSAVFNFPGTNVPAMACIKLPVSFHRMVSR